MLFSSVRRGILYACIAFTNIAVFAKILNLFRIAKDYLLILPLSLISRLPSAVKASQDTYKHRFHRYLYTRCIYLKTNIYHSM